MSDKARTEAALKAEVEDRPYTLGLDDFSDTIFVFVDGQLMEDSIPLEDEQFAKDMVERAESYGEVNCWYYVHKAEA